MNYVFHLLIYFGIYAILAMGLNLVVGYCGLLSLAHAGYFAIGAYAYALGTLAWGLDSISALLLAFMAGGVLSLLTSLPTWRLRGDYFVMASAKHKSLKMTYCSSLTLLASCLENLPQEASP